MSLALNTGYLVLKPYEDIWKGTDHKISCFPRQLARILIHNDGFNETSTTNTDCPFITGLVLRKLRSVVESQ